MSNWNRNLRKRGKGKKRGKNDRKQVIQTHEIDDTVAFLNNVTNSSTSLNTINNNGRNDIRNTTQSTRINQLQNELQQTNTNTNRPLNESTSNSTIQDIQTNQQLEQTAQMISTILQNTSLTQQQQSAQIRLLVGINNTTPSTTRDDTNYGQLIYQEQQIKPFPYTFPESRLMKEIEQSLDTAVVRNWHRYRTDAYTIYLHSSNNNGDNINTATSNIPVKTKKQFLLEFNTVNNYEKFVVKTLNVNPHISYFKNQLNRIQTRKNEDPQQTFKTVMNYLDQIEWIVLKVNQLIPNPVRTIMKREKEELMHRIFVADNAKPEHGNDGKLNYKVKHKLAIKWENNPDLTLLELEQHLSVIVPQILPNFEVDINVEES
eukprot:17658_1